MRQTIVFVALTALAVLGAISSGPTRRARPAWAPAPSTVPPDLVFDGSTLYWPELGEAWPAISGPFGRGALPTGRYWVLLRQAGRRGGPAFRGARGSGFFVPISPQFPTNRTALGIHPDGGRRGTKGCIGVNRASAARLYGLLMAKRSRRTLVLEVR